MDRISMIIMLTLIFIGVTDSASAVTWEPAHVLPDYNVLTLGGPGTGFTGTVGSYPNGSALVKLHAVKGNHDNLNVAPSTHTTMTLKWVKHGTGVSCPEFNLVYTANALGIEAELANCYTEKLKDESYALTKAFVSVSASKFDLKNYAYQGKSEAVAELLNKKENGKGENEVGQIKLSLNPLSWTGALTCIFKVDKSAPCSAGGKEAASSQPVNLDVGYKTTQADNYVSATSFCTAYAAIRGNSVDGEIDADASAHAMVATFTLTKHD